MLYDFGNFGYLRLSEKAPVKELSLLALDLPECGWVPEDGSKEDIAQYASRFLLTKASMLSEYFSLDIDQVIFLSVISCLSTRYNVMIANSTRSLALVFALLVWLEAKII